MRKGWWRITEKVWIRWRYSYLKNCSNNCTRKQKSTIVSFFSHFLLWPFCTARNASIQFETRERENENHHRPTRENCNALAPPSPMPIVAASQFLQLFDAFPKTYAFDMENSLARSCSRFLSLNKLAKYLFECAERKDAQSSSHIYIDFVIAVIVELAKASINSVEPNFSTHCCL